MSEVHAEVAREAQRLAEEKEGRVVKEELGHPTHLTKAARKDLQRARKPKMRTKVFYLCDDCGNTISEPEHGFVVHGNIYTADPAMRGGLIGNNFPNVDSETPITIEDVEQTVLCRSCFCTNLGLTGLLPKAKKKSVKRDFKDEEKVHFQRKFPDMRQGREEEPEIPFEDRLSYLEERGPFESRSLSDPAEGMFFDSIMRAADMRSVNEAISDEITDLAEAISDESFLDQLRKL